MPQRKPEEREEKEQRTNWKVFKWEIANFSLSEIAFFFVAILATSAKEQQQCQCACHRAVYLVTGRSDQHSDGTILHRAMQFQCSQQHFLRVLTELHSHDLECVPHCAFYLRWTGDRTMESVRLIRDVHFSRDHNLYNYPCSLHLWLQKGNVEYVSHEICFDFGHLHK